MSFLPLPEGALSLSNSCPSHGGGGGVGGGTFQESDGFSLVGNPVGYIAGLDGGSTFFLDLGLPVCEIDIAERSHKEDT